MKIRQTALILHRYAGVILGILLIIISVTGSLLVFSEEIDSFFHPQLFKVVPQEQQLSVQRIVDVAQNLYPDFKTHRIIVPGERDRTYTVMMISPQDEYFDVYVNPYSGEVAGFRPWKQSLEGFLIELHVNLFAGDLGTQVVGVCGVIFILMGVTGLILWNGWRSLKYGFKIRWKSPWLLVNYDLHKVGGVLSVLLLTLLAFTGTVMTFWTPFEAAVYNILRTPLPPSTPQSTVVAGVNPKGIDELVQIAQTTLPDTKIFKIFPAKKPEDPFSIWMNFLQENEFHKTSYLYFDQYTGKLLQIDNPKEASLASHIMNSQYVLHVGEYGGMVTRILYSLIGIIPLGLLITGLILWRQKSLVEARRRQIRELARKSVLMR